MNSRFVYVADTLKKNRDLIVDDMPVGVVVIDSEGEVTYANPTAKTLLETELKGADWRVLVDELFDPQEDDGFEVTTHAGRRLSIQTSSMRGGQGQIVTLTDMTASKAHDLQFFRQTQLQDQSRWLAQMAHQMRTPLSSAVLYASMLDTDQHDEKQKLLQRLDAISTQINDMLDIAKGDPITIDWMPIASILDGVERLIEDWQAHHKIHFQVHFAVDEGLLVQGNQQAILSVFQSILENSVKWVEFMADNPDKPADWQPIIRVVGAVHANDCVIDIEDTGPGVPKSDQHCIFEPFYTAKSRPKGAEKVPGHGLGLALAEQVLDAHGGSIEYVSGSQGAHFRAYLPVTRRVGAGASAVESPETTLNYKPHNAETEEVVA